MDFAAALPPIHGEGHSLPLPQEEEHKLRAVALAIILGCSFISAEIRKSHGKNLPEGEKAFLGFLILLFFGLLAFGV